MACCHKVMLLLDTAGGAVLQTPARRAALRLLTYLGCRFGLARVHWAFKFFDSRGARGRASRASDFRELGPRSWEDFEAELEARLGGPAPGAALPDPAPRASHTHGALMETLLDYQWDRPEIASPAKPILRSRGRRLLDAESEARETEAALGGLANAVFLLAPCPHSQRELARFVSGCEAQRPPPTPQQVMEKLLPRTVREVMVARKITLYWVDITARPKLWESPDHVGYWTICELLHHGGGTVLPPETFSWGLTKAGETMLEGEAKMSSEPHLSPWISALPTDATLNYLLYNSAVYEASFPRTEGALFLPVKGKEIQETWTVTLEPLAMYQRHFQNPVRIFLKGSVAQWSLPMSGTLGTDSWMLQSPEENRLTQGLLFQQLVSSLMAEELHLVASVDPGEGWPPVTGILSPLSASALILTVFHAKEAEFQGHYLQTVVAEGPQDTVSLFSDVTDGVLNQIHRLFEDAAASAPPVPEWAQQELSCTKPWSPAVLEKWFTFSNISGASSNLMESFWLLQAASANKEQSSKTESELTHRLSELYKRKSRKESTVANQEDTKKKRGIPRTPVRQKMNTMCRSLKMLNVARLNVKAQKLHPDGSPDAAGEKAIQKTVGGRTADKLEDRGRALKSSKPKDFKTEEELLSYIHENYQKTVATAEIPLHSCARNMISTIKVFLKSKGTKEVEVNCLNHIKSGLLKTSKSLRQNLGKKLDKEDAVRECQLQVFLHLEMCLQCPSILENPDEMEQVVDEITALLRIVCRTEDSAYVPHFLEEILKLYTDSIPETLGKLYNSLGLEIPPKLAGVLPPDFFSDDSMTQESKSPLSVPLPSSAHRSMSGSTEADQLEELRTKSAKKRKNALVRHKSLAEVSQNLRQIEIPQVSKRTTKSESLHPAPQQPALPAKGTAQVTKVRRNLFNQEMISPSKRSLKRGLPRSHSVSALEDLDRKCDNIKKTKSTTFRGYHKLLTKSVAETPVHKQISRRLLHRQIKGRSSDPGPDISVVEESPEKGEGEISLRRSPRIKQLSFSRTNSGSFYSVSQPKSRSVQRVHSFQQNKSDQRENSPIQSIRSPRSLLFGTVPEMVSPSEKGSARIKRLSRSKLSSETPAAYQTPKKSYQKSPTFPKTIPRGFPRTPQIPPHTPEGPLHPAAEVPPAEPALAEKALQDPSSPSCCSPSASRATPQEGPSPAEGASALATGTPRTPTRPGAQPPGFMLNSAWPHLVNSSPENPSRPASPTPSAAQPWSKCVTPVRHCLRTPPRAAALLGPPQGQKYQQLLLPEVSQAEEPAQILKDKAVQTPERPGDITVTSSPLRPPEKWGVSKSPLRRPSTVSPGLRDLDQKEHQASPSRATSPSCAAPSVSPTTVPPRGVASVTNPPPPPSKLGRWNRRASDPKQGSLECPPGPAAALGVATVTSPASTTGSRKDQEEGSPSPPSCPEGQRHLGAGASSDWPGSSPLLVGSDTDYLTVLEEAESQGGGSHAVRGGEGTGLRTADHAWKPPSVPNTRTSPPAPCSGPGSPKMESCALHCPGGQCQAMARPESLRVPVRPLNAPASSQTYEVELEMRASGLPKLRIKKVDSNTLTEAEVPGKEGSPVGEEASLPGLSMPRASRATSKPEATYVSPPCLHFLHSTPGKGQTYICQSCTPTHCPPSTPSPFQTDVGVPWTPSPKHNGKTTPDSIKDWPRRKRAVDCSNGHPSGRGEVGGDPLGALPLPEPQAREQALKLSLHKTPISEDFELEGVCQLPDQSPPGDSVPKAEEAFSWGQFGLGSRKRHWSPKEEAECGAKRVCEAPREDADMRKHEKGASGWTVPQLPSTGDDEVFASGCTPPPGCALRSCLSASGLQALTQSPLLLPGKAASSECLNPTDENADVFPSAAEASTFSPAISRRRPFSRTYTRKKLIS
ncbi:PREDICTED: treslin isoform X2 [Chinchilla lanigera]|uniref:treslin isoform X2 n=1 Tax=Chinchilla lanigera TaxID=34839 RepID=UPI000698C2A1|nr:PREDICTED: treslin isoform X2 [Chinchilla lanigera]